MFGPFLWKFWILAGKITDNWLETCLQNGKKKVSKWWAQREEENSIGLDPRLTVNDSKIATGMNGLSDFEVTIHGGGESV